MPQAISAFPGRRRSFFFVSKGKVSSASEPMCSPAQVSSSDTMSFPYEFLRNALPTLNPGPGQEREAVDGQTLRW